jgi:hypothetical protein
VHLAESQNDWEAAIMECIAEEKTPALLQGRFEFAKANTWGKRAEVIEKQIQQLLRTDT